MINMILVTLFLSAWGTPWLAPLLHTLTR